MALLASIGLIGSASIAACLVDTDGLVTDEQMDASVSDASIASDASVEATLPANDDTGIGNADAADAPDAEMRDAEGDEASPGQMDAGSDASAYATAVLADMPIAYWPFNEPAGSNIAVDVVGGLAASVQGTVIFGVPGVDGTAVRFDSISSLRVGDHLDLLGQAPFAIELWAKPDQLDAGTFQNLVTKRAGAQSNGYVMYFSPDEDIDFEENWNNDAGQDRIGFLAAPATNDYVYIVWTLGLDNHVHLYANGIEATNEFDAVGGPTPNGQTLTIGNDLAGVIDELAYYDHELTVLQVNAHYLARHK